MRIAVDYSSQHSILEAARCAPRRAAPISAPRHSIACCRKSIIQRLPASEVDLLIRTGSEQRLSDFMLWECAYAELYFTDCLWPDFDEKRFRSALEDYAGRQRRFGALIADTR